MQILNDIKFDEKGLIAAVAQDIHTKEVLMVAYMNRESLERTIKDKKACYFSRSRQMFWLKGETSGNFQFVKSIKYDCDKDSLLVEVEQIGDACHTGNRTCFYRNLI